MNKLGGSMSVEIVKRELLQFIQSEKRNVLALKGAWGTGKTHCWNKVLEENKSSISLKKYAYVSLFGVNSLEELKSQIFQNLISPNQVGEESSWSSIKAISDRTKSIFRKGTTFLNRAIEAAGKTTLNFDSAAFAPFISNILFKSVRESLICIDDLERKGDQLKIKDVLGLMSQLKEQQNCSIVILLNHNESGLEEYFKYCEKVVDKELVFEPTPLECAAIAFRDLQSCLTEHLNLSITKLNITNIRILKLVENNAITLEPIISHCTQPTLQEIAHSLVLFVYVNYVKSSGVPTFNEIKRFDRFDSIRKKRAVEDYEAFLNQYGWNDTSEFDLVLMQFVENGYWDDSFNQVLDETDRKYQIGTKENEFQQAWDAIFNSFGDGNEEIENLMSFISDNIHIVNLWRLQNVVWLMRELGEDDKANALIEAFIEHNQDNLNVFDLSNYHFNKDLDQGIVKRFNEMHTMIAPAKSLEDVLTNLAKVHGWLIEDIDLLSQVKTDELVLYFRGLQEDKFKDHIQASLQFKKIGGAGEREQAFSKRAEEALLILAEESKLNQLRVEMFGVSKKGMQ